MLTQTLSPESHVHLEVALSRALEQDEALYARALSTGVSADHEEMRALAESIGGQHILLEVLRRAVLIHVTLPD